MSYVRADESDAPLVLFLGDGSRFAPAAHGAGYAFAWVGGTEPCRSIDGLVRDSHLPHDPSRVFVVGHGAGAHRAAVIAAHDPRPAGFVLLSGVYDTGARTGSPLRQIGASSAECVVGWAAGDTGEVRHQGQAWATVWSMSHWNRQAVVVEAAGRDHFDVLDDLFDESTALGTAVHGAVRSVRLRG